MAEWKRTLRGFDAIFVDENHNETRARLLSQKLNRFKKRLFPNDAWLESIIEDFNIFTLPDGQDYFDLIMSDLYDWADDRRVWIEPRGRA